MPAVSHRQAIRRLAAVGLAAVLAPAFPAAAQPLVQPQSPPHPQRLPSPAAPLTEPEARAAGIARALMGAIDFRNYLVGELSGADFAAAHGLDAQPGWEDRLRAAAGAEVDAQGPLLELKAGRLFAMTFTARELAAVEALLQQPGGQALLAYARGAAAGQAPPPPSGEARAQIEAFLATPEGKSFKAKAEHLDALAEQLKDEVVEALTPGVVRRFNDAGAGAGATP